MGSRLAALDDRVVRRWPALFRESSRSRAWTIVFFQSFALICLLVATATGNPALVGLISGPVAVTLGIAIRELRRPPSDG